jgi:hypothetical protein
VNTPLSAIRRPVVAAALVLAAVALAVPTFALGKAGGITVVSPKPGATISGSTVVLKINTDGFKVTDQATKVRPNEGHFHVFFDKRPFVAVYGKAFRFRGIKAGSHTLKVQPVTSAHMPAQGYKKPIVVKFKTTG